VLSACGTTKWSDTSRTATEQLVLSGAIDRAVNEIDFSPLAGKKVYFDSQYLKGVTDENYIVSSLMQHMLSYGCTLTDNREDSDYVLIARAGTVGTNRYEVMLGVPQINLPAVSMLAGVPSSIPEVPFAKTTQQRGVAKIAVFAINRHTGREVWQSGLFPVSTTAKDTWILGSGPFQSGSIYDGTHFAGSTILRPFHTPPEKPGAMPAIPVTAEAVFPDRPIMATQPKPPGEEAAASAASEAQIPPDAIGPAETEEDRDVVQAGHIVRLPPLDRRDRPDLADAVRDDGREIEPPRRFDAPRDSEALSDPGVADNGFNLFRPRTWFGGG
jgi:hypothetical protein